MHCNGKCHLKKQLQKEEEQQKKEGQTTQQKFEVHFCNNTSYKNFEPSYSENNIIHTTSYNNMYSFISIHSFFHPPSA